MKIAVLISGGVDSAVVVDRLYKEGHDLSLFYIRIGMDTDEGDCSAEEDIEMCTLIARKYSLPLKVVSLHEEYWSHVMAYTLETVRKGLTPHPDMNSMLSLPDTMLRSRSWKVRNFLPQPQIPSRIRPIFWHA